jgi:ABC-type lipoprotein export system ATPase subunit
MAVDIQRERLAPGRGAVEEAPVVEAIVEARGVQKTYDTGKVQVYALRGVDLAIERGEMVAIMGPSGCGKTTLLNCLSGLDAISDGDVLIEGVSLAQMSDRERTDYRARRMGFVFQFYNLMPVLTTVENVELPLLVARVPAKEARRGRWRRSQWSDSSGGATTSRTSSREASASAQRSRGLW